MRAVKGSQVFLIGAGNSAGQAAVQLAEHAAHVTIVVRGTSLGASMSDYLVTKIGATPNIGTRFRTEVVGGHGDGRLEQLILHDRDRDTIETMAAAALFVLIGAEPRTEWLRDTIACNRQGYVLTGRDVPGNPGADRSARQPLYLETSLPGVFAAGDVRYRSVKRVASAVGEGAVAVQLIHEYLSDLATSAMFASGSR